MGLVAFTHGNIGAARTMRRTHMLVLGSVRADNE